MYSPRRQPSASQVDVGVGSDSAQVLVEKRVPKAGGLRVSE